MTTDDCELQDTSDRDRDDSQRSRMQKGLPPKNPFHALDPLAFIKRDSNGRPSNVCILPVGDDD